VFFGQFLLRFLNRIKGTKRQTLSKSALSMLTGFLKRGVSEACFINAFLLKDLCCCLSMQTSSAGENRYQVLQRPDNWHPCGYSIYSSYRGQNIVFTYHSKSEFLFNNELNGRSQLEHFGLTCGLNC